MNESEAHRCNLWALFCYKTVKVCTLCVYVYASCSGSVVVTAYDFESGRPGSNAEWGPIYYKASITVQGLLEPSSLRGSILQCSICQGLGVNPTLVPLHPHPKFSLTPTILVKKVKKYIADPLWFYHKSSTGTLVPEQLNIKAVTGHSMDEVCITKENGSREFKRRAILFADSSYRLWTFDRHIRPKESWVLGRLSFSFHLIHTEFWSFKPEWNFFFTKNINYNHLEYYESS